MRTRGYAVIFLSLLLHTVSAQGINYKFRVRYGDYSPLANSTFIISGYRLSTDPQGIISFKCANEINYVNIESAALNKYEIKYPQEGRAVLPKDPGTFVDIYVAQPVPDPLKQIKAEITSSQSTFQTKIIKKLEEESRKGYNGIVELLNTKNVDEAQLEKGRLEFFPLISLALNNYLNESRNFNDAVLALSNSLNNKGAYEQLNSAIYSYNDIFNLVNANKDIYQQAIATYWNSKELSLKFSNLIDFAMEDLHRPYILEVNYTYINKIYEINRETNKNKKKKQQEELKLQLGDLSSAMSRRLVSLGERITNMNTLLNNNKKVED
ncbi:hypothetical protein ADIARSV_4010 [Arcticibacter svalbardensis MN12-7]|uniref:Uncharacterized protein n=1 Tax=Arcticibacter svalbardensis MN12-7 TaxID=1150600 RepID=R9GM58_9SPHI|nr:hypothetical protein [Arcticibacter svalbardensis]EOR92922.1 hypothetical protein ADIARSV_4010 [Arcticibacter svalbardensis MN12-7]